MIVEIGLCYALYSIGERIYRQLVEEDDLPKADGATVSMEKDHGTGVFEKKETDHDQEEAKMPAENPETMAKRYADMSLLSMGMFALTPLLGPLGIFPYFYGAIPYVKDVKKSLVENKKINVDVLFFAADLLTLSTGRFFTAAFGLYLIHAGKLAVARAKDNSQKLVMHLFEELPKEIIVIDANGKGVKTPLEAVQKGDLVDVGAGEIIPVDGTIVEGFASIDQHVLTGESQPVEKGNSDIVLANTLVIAGNIRIRVERSGFDTTSYQIADMLFNSVNFKSDLQLKGEEWADKMTLPMLIAAGIALPVLGPVSTAVLINGHIGVRIKLLGPLGTLKHISLASQQGVLVKDGRALEKLHLVDTILFDKTGTITIGDPEVINIISSPPHTEDMLLNFAAAAEKKQSHPIARAIIKEAQKRDLEHLEIHDTTYTIGYGISVQVGDNFIRVGSDRFFTDQGMSIPQNILDSQKKSHNQGNIFIMVGINDEVSGAIELQPRVQAGMEKLIQNLRAQGIKHMAIVSGDHASPTKRLADELGFDDYYYDVLPQDKAKIVEMLKNEGKTVCFIGDGINDSMALKQADVSISMAGASTIATDMAEMIFMDGNISSLDHLVSLSVQLNKNLKQSLSISLVPSVVNVAGAFVLNFDILTSLLVNMGCNIWGMRNVMPPAKSMSAMEQLEKQTINGTPTHE